MTTGKWIALIGTILSLLALGAYIFTHVEPGNLALGAIIVGFLACSAVLLS